MLPNLNAEQARLGLSNKDVADRLGITRTTYEQKKKSTRFVVSECVELCKLFQCNFDYLFSQTIRHVKKR